MPNYKLTYFNARGRAETIRMVFAAAGMKYEDLRIDGAAWGAMKPNTPWGTLPLLEVDGRVIGQSIAIARFVAKEAGFMGKNDNEAAGINSVVDVVTEIREKAFGMAHLPEGPAKAAAIKAFLEKTLPSTLPNLEKFVAMNPERSGFFVGNKLSLADIHFYYVIGCLLPNMPSVLITHPHLKALYDRVNAWPGIVEYIKRRPVTTQ